MSTEEIRRMVEEFTKSIEDDPGAYKPMEEDFSKMPIEDQIYHLRGSLFIVARNVMDLLTWFGNSVQLTGEDFAELGGRILKLQEILEANFSDFIEDDKEQDGESSE